MRRWVRLAGSALLIALFVWVFGSADVASRLRGISAGWVAVGVGFLLAQTVVMAMRWRLVARCLDIGFPLGWAIREYLISQFVNTTLPGGVVGDGARAVRSKVGPGGLKRAALVVVCERALGQAGLIVVGVGGLIWAAIAPEAFAWPEARVRYAAMAGVLIIAALGLGALVLRGGRIGAIVAECLPTARVRIAHGVLSVSAALLNVAAFAACARATGVALPLQAILVIVPLVLTAMIIPVGVAGWGWREGAAAALFPLAGASSAAGVAAGIVFGIAIMIAVLPAVPFLLWRSPRPVPDATAPEPG
ncbi:hypothetical protein PAA8504_03622 [Palleronia abyssalis]|uniref:Lysylphosphatidylglycerol synthase TM region n=1 Tax=Palleronia abyssalis TaxID=1501240 RepID=A0A2R8C031_9RHOB|nr:hypothetical protein PAA8504_03622 [Palleronia abyssalis]